MIRSKEYLISLILALMPILGQSQNLYDLGHSKEFAGHLMRTGQYSLASGEWERVLFLSPGDTTARINLINSYRLAGNPAEALRKLYTWYPAGPLPKTVAKEGLQLTLMQGDFSGFGNVLKRSTTLSISERSNYQLGAWLMQDQWINREPYPDLPGIVAAVSDTNLLNVYHESLMINRKSRGTAVALSFVVPGLGKIYSGDWKDGLMTMLFVGVNAWQSYRGFSREGVKSVSGWIFGTMAFGFYSANLFGSWKSAGDYNQKQLDRIKHETEGYLFNR
jgi:hypothetical protein